MFLHLMRAFTYIPRCETHATWHEKVQRGTFSHRHAVVKDQDTEEEYTPLNSLARMLSMSAPLEELRLPDTQAKLIVRNSILSEFAVLVSGCRPTLFHFI